MRRLHSPGELCNCDTSGMGSGDNGSADIACDEESKDNDSATNDTRDTEEQLREALDSHGFCHVQFVTRNSFRSKFIEHFDILCEQNQLQWPKSHSR